MLHLPLKAGAMFQTSTPATPINCPSDISRKKRGIPPITRKITYGIRNDPEKYNKSLLICG